MKEFMITNSSIMEIQNLNVNPKSLPKSNPEQYQFSFKYISSTKYKYISSKNQWFKHFSK